MSEEPKSKIDDLPTPEEALTPRQAEEAEGGIIAILIGAKAEQPAPKPFEPNRS